MPLQAIVLDFDGVIADTEPLHFRVFREVLLDRLEVDLTAEDYYARYLGYDDAGAFEAIAAGRTVELGQADLAALVAEKARRFDASLADADVLFPGAADAVRRLAATVPLAVASGALRHEIELVLARAGLSSCVQAIVAAGETAASKPAPDPYTRAVRLLGVPPANAVAVEDSRWGLESARAAGLRCVVVTTSYPASTFPDADLVLPALAAVRADALVGLFATA